LHRRCALEFVGAAAVGIEHRVEQRRARDAAEQIDVGNHAVAADEARTVFDAGQEIDFLENPVISS